MKNKAIAASWMATTLLAGGGLMVGPAWGQNADVDNEPAAQSQQAVPAEQAVDPSVDSEPEEETETLVVRGARIPDEKRATAEISSIIDSASFQRTGDSDIASALQRVTGLSLSEGKYIIVRGLNERYSSVTLNGAPLPSPEPLQRVVPLNIVPTAILAGSTVQKTFSPEHSAEFGGGSIELRTLAIPKKAFFELGASFTGDLTTTGRDGLSYDGGQLDFLGFDDGTRTIPGPLGNVFVSGLITPANQQAIDLSLENNRTLLVTRSRVQPNYSLNAAFGDRVDLTPQISLGATIALNYSDESRTRRGRREQGFTVSATTPNIEASSADFTSTQRTIDTSAFGSFGLDVGNHSSVTWTNFVLRSTEKQARNSIGVDGDDLGLLFNRTNTEFLERQVWQTQLRGEHKIPLFNDKAKVVWRGAYGEAYRDSPYQREVTYIRDITLPTQPFRFDASGLIGSTPNTLAFSRIGDQNIDAGIDIEIPFQFAKQDVKLKFGYAFTNKDRFTINRNFEFQSNIAVPSSILTSRIDSLLSGPVIETGIFDLTLLQATIDLDNSRSSLTVHGAYIGFDVGLGQYFRLAAGGRFEDGVQATNAFSTTSPVTSFSRTEINEDYFLPAITLTWNPISNLQSRIGFSQTINRPQFRELTPAFFLNEDTNLLFRGNPFLTNSRLNNYDLRFEYYFSRGQFVTLGGFYKGIDRPIEEQFARDLGGLPLISFINAPRARLYGFEFEFERNYPLSNLSKNAFWATKDLVFKTNYTYTISNVSADGNVITPVIDGNIGARPSIIPASSVFVDGRALQGQSRSLYNLQLGYADAEHNSEGTLVLNYASARIRNVELIISPTTIAPQVIERPPVTLDFVYSRKLTVLGGIWEFGFKAENILGDDYDATQTFPNGSVTRFDTYGLGRKLSVNLKRKF